MSDLSIPSYRVQREGGVPWRMLAVSGGILAALAAGGAAVWGVSRAVTRDVPVIAADPRPVRVRPDDPGGLRVANQDERIFETQRNQARGAKPGQPVTPAAPGAQPRAMAESERPNLEALRQAAAPPRPAAPNPAASAPTDAPVPAAAQPAPVPAAAAPHAAPEPAARHAAVEPPAPRPSVTGGRALVQLGALSSEESARAEWDRLRRRLGDLLDDRRPQVVRFDRDGQSPMWRLRTGGFADEAAARAFCNAAKSRGATACATIGG